jgi:hypothetical protein
MRGHKGSISCLKPGVGRTCMSASYDNTLYVFSTVFMFRYLLLTIKNALGLPTPKECNELCGTPGMH